MITQSHGATFSRWAPILMCCDSCTWQHVVDWPMLFILLRLSITLLKLSTAQLHSVGLPCTWALCWLSCSAGRNPPFLDPFPLGFWREHTASTFPPSLSVSGRPGSIVLIMDSCRFPSQPCLHLRFPWALPGSSAQATPKQPLWELAHQPFLWWTFLEILCWLLSPFPVLFCFVAYNISSHDQHFCGDSGAARKNKCTFLLLLLIAKLLKM